MFKNLSVAALGVSGRQSEIIELALSNGFKGIDLDLREIAALAASQGLAHARRLLDSSKLKYGSAPLPVRWTSDADYAADLQALPQMAELAATLGCTRLVTILEPASNEQPFHENFETHRRRLSEIAGVLAKHGVSLAVGFNADPAQRAGKHYEFIYSLDNLLMLLSLVASKNVGVAADLWALHVTGAGGEGLKKLKRDQLLTVELSDAKDNLPESGRLLPGEAGNIDAAAALAYLAEIGYDGPVTPHRDPKNYPAQSREAIGREAAQKLDAAWKAAGLSPAGKLQAMAGK
jgi:sugar phosphate isomerase/epimerase